MEITESLKRRFWEKVDRRGTDECWYWTGARNGPGLNQYGRIGLNATEVDYAHRVSWTIHNGPIPAGLCVLHRCDTPPCVNPTHLFLGTKKDNMLDKESKGRGYAPMSDPRRWGEGSPNAKLDNKKVRSIRKKYSEGSRAAALAKEYGVDTSQIYNVVNRKQWVNVE